MDKITYNLILKSGKEYTFEVDIDRQDRIAMDINNMIEVVDPIVRKGLWERTKCFNSFVKHFDILGKNLFTVPVQNSGKAPNSKRQISSKSKWTKF